MPNSPESSGCWVFNEDQLARALRGVEGNQREVVLWFLTSEAARDGGLIVPTDCDLKKTRGGVLRRILKLKNS